MNIKSSKRADKSARSNNRPSILSFRSVPALVAGALLSLSFCGGCRTDAPEPAFRFPVPPEFKGQVTQWEELMAENGVNYQPLDRIRFAREGELGETTLGQCRWSANFEQTEILISPSYWDQLGTKGRLALIYHEMGHCALGLSHKDSWLETEDSIFNVRSMMSTYSDALSESWMELSWDTLIEDYLSYAKTSGLFLTGNDSHGHDKGDTDSHACL